MMLLAHWKLLLLLWLGGFLFLWALVLIGGRSER